MSHGCEKGKREILHDISGGGETIGVSKGMGGNGF
jgi:hypothetical protein